MPAAATESSSSSTGESAASGRLLRNNGPTPNNREPGAHVLCHERDPDAVAAFEEQVRLPPGGDTLALRFGRQAKE